MELTITKEKVLEAASKCSTAKATLEVLFPEVFKSKEKITKYVRFEDNQAIEREHSLEVGDRVMIFDLSYIDDFKFNYRPKHNELATILSIEEKIFVKWSDSIVPLSIRIKTDSGHEVYCPPFCLEVI